MKLVVVLISTLIVKLLLAKPRTYMMQEPIKVFMKMNTASSLGLGTHPGNAITNLKEDLKGITTRSGTAYQGPTIPTTFSSLPNVVECKAEVTKDTVHLTNNGSTIDVQPPVVQAETPILNSKPVVAPIIEPVVSPVSALKPNQKPSIPFSDVIVSGNPTPYYDLIISTSFSTLTPFEDSDFHLKEFDAFLALEDEPTSPEVDQSYFDPEGDILLLEAFLNDDPSLPPPNQGNYLSQVRKELKICEAKTNKSSIDEPREVELKDLPPHLEYAFLEGDDKLPVIIAKDLGDEEKTALITVLKSHNGLAPEKGQSKNLRCHQEGEKMLKWCEDTDLCLNWENSHFMVKEGIVLGHKISKNGIEVDKAKVEVIAKLPHPTTVKGIRGFLGHAG
nr:reverse transcriptase domain-containing protein [Tanacetum cinerariifolium]